MHRFSHFPTLGKALLATLGASLITLVSVGSGSVVHAADQTVTSIADDGSAGTLRAAIDSANASGGGTITIAVAGTITLTSALPSLTASTTIVGTGVGTTVINTNNFRFINSTAAIAVEVSDLTLTGSTSGDQGAIVWRQNGTTTLRRVELTGNVGGSFARGVIYQQQNGATTIVDSSIHDNVGQMIHTDHGNTPASGTDTIASPQPDTYYGNRLYVQSSTFANNSQCVIQTYRFITITDSSFTGNSGVCLDGLNRKTIARTTFTGNGTAVRLSKNAAWDIPMRFDAVQITGNSVGISGASTTTSITNSTICTNGTDLSTSGGVLNPQTVILTNSFVGETCPVATTTTSTATTTTSTSLPPTTTVPAVTTTAAPLPTTTDQPAPATGVTTAPDSTVPPATLPLLQPAQVVAVTGLAAGDASAIDGSGAVLPVVTQVVDGRVVISTNGMSVAMQGPVSSRAGASVGLQRAQVALVEGAGFLPGSTVNIWLFSEPTLWTETIASPDGTFSVTATVPTSIALGSHTIVVSGLRSDGVAQAMALGVTVGRSADGLLPATGDNPWFGLLAGFVMVVAGVVLVTRRRSPA